MKFLPSNSLQFQRYYRIAEKYSLLPYQKIISYVCNSQSVEVKVIIDMIKCAHPPLRSPDNPCDFLNKIKDTSVDSLLKNIYFALLSCYLNYRIPQWDGRTYQQHKWNTVVLFIWPDFADEMTLFKYIRIHIFQI